MPDYPTGSGWTVPDLYASVRSEWKSLALVVLAAVIIALIVGVALPRTYSSTAALTVAALDQTDPTRTVNMETERAVATSSSVLDAAARKMGSTSGTDLADALEVTVPKGAQVLEFTVTLGNAKRASEAANAIADSYDSLRVANAERSVTDATTTLSARIAALNAAIAAEGGGDSSASAVQARALEESLATLNAVAFTRGTVVTTAEPARSPSNPSIAIFLAGGLALGLLIGVFVALSRARDRDARSVSHDSESETVASPVIAPAEPTVGEVEVPKADVRDSGTTASPAKKPVARKPRTPKATSRPGDTDSSTTTP